MSRVVIGRIASMAFIVASALFLVSDLLFPGSYSKASTLMVGGLTLVAGFASWWIPWERLPRSTVLWMVPFALFAVDLGYVYAVRNGFNYSVTFVIIFVLVGLTQPRWTSLQLAPLLVVAYVLPLLITSDHMSTSGLGSAIYVVPVCLLLGEATAWGMSRLAEASSEIAEGEESIRQLFDEAPIGISRSGVDGRILEVNRAFGDIVGAAPEDLVGLDILDLTHPDDVAETTSLIASLLAGEIDRYQFEKRYVHADGHLVWVSVNGSVVRDAQRSPAVPDRADRGHHRTPDAPRRAGAARRDRPADRAAQPVAVHGAPRLRPAPGRGGGPPRGPDVPRSRPVQAGQRRHRPRRR